MVANCRYSKCKSYRWLDEINKQKIEIVLKPTRNPNRDEYLKRGMDWVLQNHREKRGHHEVTPFGKQISPQFAMASTSRQTMDAGNTPGAKAPRNSEQPGFQRVDPRTHAGGRDHVDLVINSATTATPVQISHTTQTTYEQALEVERQRLEAYERAKRDHEEEEELARRKYGFSQEAQESVTQSTTMLQQEEPAPSRWNVGRPDGLLPWIKSPWTFGIQADARHHAKSCVLGRDGWRHQKIRKSVLVYEGWQIQSADFKSSTSTYSYSSDQTRAGIDDRSLHSSRRWGRKKENPGDA